MYIDFLDHLPQREICINNFVLTKGNYTHRCRHTNINIETHAVRLTHRETLICIYIHTHTETHIHVQAYIHTQIHTYTQTHIHIHTYSDKC